MTQLGHHLEMSWRDDPKRLAFMFARYKFVAKMFHGKQRVLEIGCGDGFCTEIVRREVGEVVAFDKNAEDLPVGGMCHDITKSAYPGTFDAAYSLDCLEHIAPELTDIYFQNILVTLDGPLIIGMPSLESQPYASPRSKAEHVNCMTHDQLRATMLSYFEDVFMFGMNDETLHTGFGPMCNYLLAIGSRKRA